MSGYVYKKAARLWQRSERKVCITDHKASLPITYILNRQKVLPFANQPVHKKTQTGSVQSNYSLTTKIFLSLQSCHDADMNEFFNFLFRDDVTGTSLVGERDIIL